MTKEPTQLDKFKAAAKEAECKMGPRKFDEALKDIAEAKKPKEKPKKKG